MSEKQTPKSRRSSSRGAARIRSVKETSDKGGVLRQENMDFISKKLAKLDGRRQDLAKRLDEAQKSADYENFQKIGNSYLGTILESIDLYIDLIREISSEPVAGELKTEFSDIVKRGSNTKGIEGQSEWISNDVSPLYEKVRQICACVYAAVAKIDQEANKIG